MLHAEPWIDCGHCVCDKQPFVCHKHPDFMYITDNGHSLLLSANVFSVSVYFLLIHCLVNFFWVVYHTHSVTLHAERWTDCGHYVCDKQHFVCYKHPDFVYITDNSHCLLLSTSVFSVSVYFLFTVYSTSSELCTSDFSSYAVPSILLISVSIKKLGQPILLEV